MPALVATPMDSVEMTTQRKGEFLSVKVDDALVKYGISELTHSLIGKLSLSQGDSPYSLDALHSKLSQIWGIMGEWQLVSLGRGYYNIRFSNLADRDRVLDRRSWSLKPGMIRLQRWVRGFNPYKVNSTLAQVWVRIYEIPMEYFQPKIVHALASDLGTVIKMDERTRNRTMCHYARVLIEIDMTKGCEDYIMFESEEQVMFASLKYEQLLPFCSHCGIVGHSLDGCISVKSRKGEDESLNAKPLGRQSRNKQKDEDWVPKARDQPQENDTPTDDVVLSKNEFQALADLKAEEIDQEGRQANQGANLSIPGVVEEDMIGKPPMEVNHSLLMEEEGQCGQGTGSRVEDVAIISSGTSSSSLRPSVSGRKGGKEKLPITKEYNLRNRPADSNGGSRLASPPHDTSYVITSRVDNEALASMKLASSRSWADQCEDEDFPPKHGTSQVDQ